MLIQMIWIGMAMVLPVNGTHVYSARNRLMYGKARIAIGSRGIIARAEHMFQVTSDVADDFFVFDVRRIFCLSQRCLKQG